MSKTTVTAPVVTPLLGDSPSASVAVQVVLSRLAGVEAIGRDNWKTFCPVHESPPEEHKRSLDVKLADDGKILVCCHAGCENRAIMKAIGLTLADLMPARQADRPRADAKVKGRVVATYNYRDPAGALQFQVVRLDPKDFRQRRHYDGDWVWGLRAGEYARAADGEWRKADRKTPAGSERIRLPATPRVLYRLPELLAADKQAWVFVVEGEKDVDKLASLGVFATTNPGGAGKWNKLADDSMLHGRRAAIIADKDSAGLAHAQDVAGRLYGKAAIVRIIDLPDMPPAGDGKPRKDVTDWIEWAGERPAEELSAQLVVMAEAARDWMPKSNINTCESSTGPHAPAERTPQSEAIVRLALDRFRVGRTDGGEPFAVERGGLNLARMFRGGRDSFRASLAYAFRKAHEQTPNASALADALTVLEGEALAAAPEQVALRVADYQGNIVIDLGDSQGRAVIVRPGEWEVVPASPVLFRRTALTGRLPAPERGGNLEGLRHLLNVTDEIWPLLRGWLVAAMFPSIPHPILLLGGVQGTGKSTAARMLIELIDPSPALLRPEPHDREGWALAASGSWVVGLDNVSHIPVWFSDALCRACTGDGWVRRRLYTDSDLSVLAFRRVVLLTSIDPGAYRGDLGDRLLLVDLEEIVDGRRETEAELDATYHSARPQVFGALLDAVAAALARWDSVSLPALPRMADFARVLAADDTSGRSLRIYLAQRDRVASEVLDSDPVAVAILDLLRERVQWEGTAGELLKCVRPDRPPHGWPRSPRSMAAHLKRLVPAFRAVGVAVERERTGHDRQRRYVFRRMAETTVRTVRSDTEPRIPGIPCGRSADDADGGERSGAVNRPPFDARPQRLGDDADGADGSTPTTSGDIHPMVPPGSLDRSRRLTGDVSQ